ncbi:hypothetical protein [Bradyrhizobium sp. NAS80.1]|uniref:hypothetical protein n=1 Tax=Bradyrhizobium sp. NAS80.1 TaxID=1680159 RepID=UPI001160F040|nr:hypothetical protein [Bradyrhizobium sp. NAS80.1]
MFRAFPETEGLTIDKVLNAAKLVKAAPALPQFVVAPNALKDTEERLFPESRNRSRRIHKKLVKRFGGEFRKVPCIVQVGDTYYVHPEVQAELDRHLKRRSESDMERAIMGGPLAKGLSELRRW